MKRVCLFYPLLFLLASCGGTNRNVVTVSPVAPPQKVKKEEYSGPPVVLAILDFENNSITDAAKLDPLKKGFAAMIATDLGKAEAIKVVERAKLQTMMKELELSQTGMVGDSTAVEVGKMVGAKNIVFGSFIVMNGQMRVDVRMIEVETSLLVLAEEMSGVSDNFFTLEKELVQKVVASLNMKAPEKPDAKKGSKDSFRAAMLYSRGVEFMDEKQYLLAKKMFNKALAVDPGFDAARQYLESDLLKNL